MMQPDFSLDQSNGAFRGQCLGLAFQYQINKPSSEGCPVALAQKIEAYITGQGPVAKGDNVIPFPGPK